MSNFNIQKKLQLFALVIFIVIGISTIIKYNMLNNVNKNFDIYANNAVQGKILVLEIQKELNYVSRCTRDIMLGNDYEGNISKIEKSLDILNSKFDDLEITFNGSLNEAEKKKILKNAKDQTLAFVNDGYEKMKSLANTQRTDDVLKQMYSNYKKDSTPLANASRESFGKILKMKEKGLEVRSKAQHDEMGSLTTIIWIEAIVVLSIILIALFILSKNIIKSLNSFKIGLISFFDFLNKKSDNLELLKINSKDEFGEMALLVNHNIKEIKNTLDEEQKLIDEASIVINRVKHGWYSQLITTDCKDPALHQLKDGINEMIKATKEHFITVNNTLDKYANYNYLNKLEMNNIEKDGVFDQFMININKLREAINTMLQENKKNGLILEDSAEILLTNVNKLNLSSNDAAARLEETAAAVEEITSSISSSTLKIAQMSNIANNVTNSAKDGENLATKTALSMDEINQKVQAINEAITVIDQIAFQTNILSLNAAVEAATAGEAGKGFAVVAQEVRNLASRSAEAAKEIKNLVEDATLKANEGKIISDEMKKGYTSLNQNINETISIINEITSSSKEQQAGVAQINDAINSLDKQTQENASVASNTNTIASKTSIIAKKIVSNANEKEFEGKDKIKITDSDYKEDKKIKSSKNEIIKESSKEEVKKTIDSKSSKVIKPTIKNDDEEWESF